jgi:hypothetical protein
MIKGEVIVPSYKKPLITLFSMYTLSFRLHCRCAIGRLKTMFCGLKKGTASVGV